MKVAVLGLGNMGAPIARRILEAGHEVSVYNRSEGPTEKLAEAGAKVAATPYDAVRGVDVAITMLTDDPAVEQVVLGERGLIGSLAVGATHVSMSTISVEFSQRMAEAHAQKKQRYVSAPVFGRPEAAQAGKLFVVAGASAEDVARCEPIFGAIGQRTFHISEDPVAANVVKLSGNFLIASVIETFGEALALTRKYGVRSEKFVDLLTNSLFAAPVYKTYATLVATEKFEPAGFKLPLGLKDVRLVLAAADAKRVPMPVAGVIRDHMLTGLAKGMDELDWSSFSKVIAENAGLK
jgi:3-hydroxyisobutyrate dehydrogenase-like beta-hydroxyacid dehydrogenase